MSSLLCTRRSVVASLLQTAAYGVLAGSSIRMSALAQNSGRRGGYGAKLEEFRKQFRIPALSVAISRGGRFVFDHTGGMADSQHALQATQDSLFRIADLSKPITAVAIFTLLEAGKLTLNDRVFGPAGILRAQTAMLHSPASVNDITIDHLLTHTAGGWAADNNDPMQGNHGWDAQKLIARTIATVPLTSAPGSRWAYSNFGYCVLGRVIEQLTGQTYETYVQQKVLTPCGISAMQIAHNSQRQRAPEEVIYEGQYSEDPYKLNVNRMDAAAGWIASSTQLVQFLDHVAGAPGIPALLNAESIRLMTTPAPASPEGPARYARGWMVDNDGSGQWWHAGSLPGTTAFMMRHPNGSCGAALCNTRTQPHAEIDAALQQTMEDMASMLGA